MESHVRCYQAIKRSKYGNQVKIGAVMNVMQFEPEYNWDIVSKGITNQLNSLYNGIWYDYFKTGKYNFLTYSYENKDAINSLDYLGVN